MGFKQVFDDLTFKHMDALRKQIQSLADYVLNHCFWTFLGNFQNDRKKFYFRGPIWFALMSTRGMTLDKFPLPPSSSILQYK